MALAALRDVIGPGRDGQEPMPANASFVQAGIDPMSADLRRNLERLFGQPLAPTVLVNHSTLNDLARHLLSRVQVAAAQPPSASPPPPPPLAVDEIRAKLMARLAELR